jgi:sulfatase modifying factor 1
MACRDARPEPGEMIALGRPLLGCLGDLPRNRWYEWAVSLDRQLSLVNTAPKGMVPVLGGSFSMGSADFYPEEQPVRTVTVSGFWIDTHPVTVAEFRRFVKATGHVTVAEVAPDPADYPDADPALLVPGSLVFRRTSGPVPLTDYRAWWTWVPGADWRRPEGPGSNLDGRQRHPVTQVAYADALAYAAWAGKDLPTEAEWEYAARGGLDGATFPWGDDFAPGGKMMANTWQGEFPWQNLDRFERTSPVGAFPPNDFGLYDVAGNVWEWTSDRFTERHPDDTVAPCCTPSGPPNESPNGVIPRRVTKGGSHLCAPNYCLRYRPAARQGQAIDTATGHIGFRCVIRDP